MALQGVCNDRLADAVRRHPDRLQGFATLATPDPEAAAAELGRAVTKLGFNGAMLYGRTRDRNLDHPDFWPIFEAAEALNAPLYLHPQSPPPAVRGAYYSGLGDAVDAALATHGLGWHYDAGLQLLRLILGGVLDRFPGLQLILGHWGEVMLFYLDRIDRMTGIADLARPVSEYVRTNVFVTPGGVFSQRYLQWSLDVVGPDRILFATDYPYVMVPDGGGRRFLEQAETARRIARRSRRAIGNGCARGFAADRSASRTTGESSQRCRLYSPMIGAALCRHSSHSRSGSESAVMPPPTPRTALPSASNSTVRIATLSSQPATGDAKPTVPQYTPRRCGSQPRNSSRARIFGVPVTDAGGNVASSNGGHRHVDARRAPTPSTPDATRPAPVAPPAVRAR